MMMAIVSNAFCAHANQQSWRAGYCVQIQHSAGKGLWQGLYVISPLGQCPYCYSMATA